jgi:hypothetical protein
MIRVAIVVALVACSSSSPSGDAASLHSFEFAVPSGWTKQDRSAGARNIAEWTPTENDAKESITVIASPARALSADKVRDLLAKAQHGLSSAAFLPPAPFTTQQGFTGYRIEGVFVPAGQTARYRRIHAAVLAGHTIVHVLYTAKDAEPENFDLVVDNLVRKGA